MSVRQNGIVVGTLNLPSGSGPLSVQVPLCAGVPFDLFWNTGGSFATEVGVSITNPFGIRCIHTLLVQVLPIQFIYKYCRLYCSSMS
jgi:hypothetical protein